MANTKTASKPAPAKEKPQSKVKPATPPTPSQAASVADAPSTAAPAVAQSSMGMRMPTINDVKVTGRLTADPVVRAVGKQNVANFNLAVEKRYRDAQNQWQKQVSFVPVAVWGVVADRAKDLLHKGSPVYLEGRLKTDDWQTKDGEKRSIMRLEAFKVQSLAKAQSRSQGQEIGD